MAKIDDLLKARGQINGDYNKMTDCIWRIKGAVRDGNFHGLPAPQKEALDMIAHKMGRILTGDPNHEDHWRDIAGYATLVADRLK